MKIRLFWLFVFILIVGGYFQQPVDAGLSQFDTSNNKVDLGDFMSGGPPKDGIPSIDEPLFLRVKDVNFLKDDDQVVGLMYYGRARAYPIKILNWHEIVNDQIAAYPIAVTWCPLTRSAVAFDRRVNDQIIEFGVSGLLFNSNVVMYDRQTQGLWSQLKMSGVTGEFAAEDLEPIPLEIISWKDWRDKHPNTVVLSEQTGYFRDYDDDPYSEYHASDDTIFPTRVSDERLNPKDLVVGVRVNGVAKAYSLDSIDGSSELLKDRVGDVEIQIRSLDGGAVEISDKNGKILPSVVAYWFAWSTFNEGTLVYGN